MSYYRTGLANSFRLEPQWCCEDWLWLKFAQAGASLGDRG
jgi:hypothetical protein